MIMNMRNLSLLVFLSCALLYVTRFAAQYDFFMTTPPAAEAIQDFTYTRLDGSIGQLADHQGKETVLHFWATWCPPCITELPELLEKAENRPDVDFLLISVDKDQGRLRQFLQPYEKKLAAENITVIHDLSGDIAMNKIKVSGFPESLFLNSDLYPIRHIKGPISWLSFNGF